MSGAVQQGSISSIINQCQPMEELAQGAIIKAFRGATGQFKVLGPLTVPSSTTFVQEPEIQFPLKAQRLHILYATFLISSAAAGGAKLQLNAPANTSANSVLTGKVIASGTTPTGATIGNSTGAFNQTLNGTLLYSNAAVTDEVYVQALIIPAVDDVLTFSFAQNTSNATASVLLQSTNVNLLQLSSSRRAPNVV